MKQKVEQNGWDTRVKSQWKTIDETDLSNFPQLIYGTKQWGHINLSKQIRIQKSTQLTQVSILMVHKEATGILKAKVRSRHISAGSYNLWIEFGPGLEPIKGWFCKCKSDSRIVGCCAHIASVMWFLGFYRHQQKEDKPLPYKSQYMSFLTDASAKD